MSEPKRSAKVYQPPEPIDDSCTPFLDMLVSAEKNRAHGNALARPGATPKAPGRSYTSAKDRIEWRARAVVWNAIWYVLIAGRLYHGPMILRRVAAWALPYAGGWAYSQRSAELAERIKAREVERGS